MITNAKVCWHDCAHTEATVTNCICVIFQTDSSGFMCNKGLINKGPVQQGPVQQEWKGSWSTQFFLWPVPV